LALNKQFSGFVYHTNDTLGNSDIYYRVYFNKVNGSSSSSQWDTYETVEGQVRTCEATGYYAFNLGDAGILSQEGVAASGDRVLVTFFIDNDDKDSDALTAVGTYYWTMTSADNYSKDQQLVSVDETSNVYCKPDLTQWRLNSQPPAGTSNGYVNTNYSYSSANCDYVRQHSYSTTMGGTMYHYYTLLGTIVHNGFRITTREYDFDDGVGWQTLGATGVNQWNPADSYENLLRLTTGFGNSDQSIRHVDDIQLVIRWRLPVPDLECLQAVAGHVITPDTIVTFLYNGTDPDNRITGIDWVINDSTTNTYVYGADSTAIIAHTNGPGTGWYNHPASSGAFGVSGTHNIELVVHWDNGIDGTSTPDILYNEDVIQDLFSGPTVNFTQDPSPTEINSSTDFHNTSTNIGRVGTAGDGEQFDWRLDDNGPITEVLDATSTYVFTVTPTDTLATIRLLAHWNDGFTDRSSQVTKSIIFTAKITITKENCYYIFHIAGTSTGGGAPTGYKWEVYRDPDGANTLLWSSPTDLSQQDLRYYFTYVDEFLVTGTVYGAGSPTSDSSSILITEICTGGGVDATSFVLIATDPDDTETDVSSQTVIRAIFSQEVLASSVPGRFTVSNAGVPVDGTTTVTGYVVTFVPAAELEFETDYTVTASTGITNLDGTLGLLSDHVWTFTTETEEAAAGGGSALIVEDKPKKPLIIVTGVKERDGGRATLEVSVKGVTVKDG